jgi:hypothetical protein
LGEYKLIKNDQIYTATQKEQHLSGITWGDLGEAKWSVTGSAKLYIKGNYQWGQLQSYEYNYEKFDFAAYLSCTIYTPDALDHDIWYTTEEMWNHAEGEFEFILNFIHYSNSSHPYFVDPAYNGDVVIALHQDRSLAGGDIITVPPVMTITEARLIVPEPASLLLLGLGGLFLRRKN